MLAQSSDHVTNELRRKLSANMFGTSPLVPSGDSLMLEPTDPDTLEGRMCRLVGGSQIGAGWE
jgi:hypothetical protein